MYKNIVILEEREADKDVPGLIAKKLLADADRKTKLMSN